MQLCKQLCYLVALCGTLACGAISPVVSERQTEPQRVKAPACSSTELRKQIEDIAKVTKGPVGAAVVLLDGGEVVALNGQQRFPMQSVYKLPIGMAVLHQVDKGILKLDQKIAVKPSDFPRVGLHSPIRDKYPRGVELTVGELLRLAISESDSTASDVLMRAAGGAAAVTTYLQALGVDGIMVVDTEKEIGRNVDVQYRNWATPESALSLLRIISEGRSFTPATQAMLLKLMIETPTGPNRIKGLLPSGTIVAHKTGTAGMINGVARATNDMGLVTLPDGNYLAVVVFVSDTRVDTKEREGVIAKIARAAWDCWARP